MSRKMKNPRHIDRHDYHNCLRADYVPFKPVVKGELLRSDTVMVVSLDVYECGQCERSFSVDNGMDVCDDCLSKEQGE